MVPSNEIAWPSGSDLRLAEDPDFVHLCRIRAGLRRLSTSDHGPIERETDMTRATQQLVDLLEAVQWRVFVLVTQLRDGTATAEQQNEVVDEMAELLELLRSHADDTESGVVPTSS